MTKIKAQSHAIVPPIEPAPRPNGLCALMMRPLYAATHPQSFPPPDVNKSSPSVISAPPSPAGPMATGQGQAPIYPRPPPMPHSSTQPRLPVLAPRPAAMSASPPVPRCVSRLTLAEPAQDAEKPVGEAVSHSLLLRDEPLPIHEENPSDEDFALMLAELASS